MRRITVHTQAFPVIDLDPTCELVVVEGPDEGARVDVGALPVQVGTDDKQCDLVLTDDRVSRRHLEICVVDGFFEVRDLDSRNGTIYRGSVLKQARLRPGSTLQIGRTFLRLQPLLQPLEIPASQARRFGELVGQSLCMREIFAVLELAATSDATVLLDGETGTGKELAARAIHDESPRRRKPFVAVDCGALPDGLVESELFGHVRGAFTGASQDRQGAFARADGGTIFLDELGKISPEAQARLLRVCEERRIRPLGSDRERPVDVRIIAAGSHIEDAVEEGTFRPDLFYRLSVIHIELPPLKARTEDIALIVEELMRRRGLEAGIIAGENLARLMAHRWPGNVRELRNVIERAIALSPDATGFSELRIAISPQPSHEPARVRSDLPFSDAKELVVRDFEARYLRDLIERCDHNVSAAAREAQMDRKHLRSLLARYGLI